MKKLILITALAASSALPSAAHAQAIPGAIVAVVDLDRVTRDCNACKTAAASLRSQATALQNRQQSLAGPLETESKSIQTAIDALAGKAPDAALKTRAQAFQTRYQQAQQELARQQQQLQSNTAYVQKQISDKLNPIYGQVMQRRGANVLVEQGATLASGAALDVTNDVLAALNTSMPTLQTTAPATPATQGR